MPRRRIHRVVGRCLGRPGGGAVSVVLALVISGAVASRLDPSRAAASGAEPTRFRQPAPLRGLPLGSRTGLRLVVADRRPFVFDVDSGSVKPLNGVSRGRGVVTVTGVGGRAAIVTSGVRWRKARLYAVRGRGQVARLGTGMDAVPDGDGRSLWLKGLADDGGCTLRRLTLDGRELQAARPFSCAATIYPGGAGRLVVNRTQLLDPVTGDTVLKTPWGVLAATTTTLVLAGPGEDFTLLDVATGAQRVVRRPETLNGLDDPAVDPRDRFVVLAFADPAWQLGSHQALDLWLLDTQTAKLTHLPGMPAFVHLKLTSMAWADDGRLLLLAEDDRSRSVVVVWRPGQRRLALKTVHLQARTGGSDSFAPVR